MWVGHAAWDDGLCVARDEDEELFRGDCGEED